MLGGFDWVVLRPHEPVFEGKPLSLVLHEAYQHGRHTPSFYSAAYYPDESEIHRMRAERALRALGTNALPVLVKMAGTRMSAFRKFVGEPAGDPQMAFLHLPPQEGKHEIASWGIRLLGKEARPAVPALIRLLSDRDLEVQCAAAECLAGIGPEAAEAVPALVQMLRNCSRAKQNEVMAAFSAAHFGNQGLSGRARSWYEAMVVHSAAHALGEIGPAASAAASALEEVTNDATLAPSHAVAAVALIKISQGSFQPFFERLKDTSDPNKWTRAAIEVGRLGTNADPAIPLLLAAFEHTNDAIQRTAVMAVGELHRRADLCLGPLVSLVNSANLIRRSALDALARFGPAAKPVAPEIARWLDDSHPDVRSGATNILRLIDPDAPALRAKRL